MLVGGVVVLAVPNPLAAQDSAASSSSHGAAAAYDALRADDPSCQPFSLLNRDAPGACSEFHLDGAGDDAGHPSEPEPSGRAAAIEAKKLQLLLASFVSAGAVAGGALNAFTDTPRESFHFASEGFFGRRTYAGGADKASHFVDYSILSKELANLYDRMGFSRDDSILLGLGVSVAAGLMNEVGDGTNSYGFSWEDLTMDVLGAGTSAVIAAARLEDLIGFRHGVLLPAAGTRYCCAEPRQGRDYSNEIYTADLQLEGLARRLDLNVGPLRYLLFSATYGTKGYPGGAPDARERQVGFEIGLNFRVILNDLGARRNTWWGYTLHIVFDNFRVPFTSVGYRYDLNHNKWIGPDNGNGFATR
ncbi:MAG: hypothetical protein DME01_14395 [Candidatus Rokuibacteriota bacterium]|nr:MAG: hypothetical protein DME01_14395 [Candidatus Rokubacteria bacterium]